MERDAERVPRRPMMRVHAQTLREIVSAAEGSLCSLREPHVSTKPAPGKWAKKEILGHLIDSACNNHQRFVRAQLEAALRFPSYEQEGWAGVQKYLQHDWSLLVQLWAAYNRHLAHVIAMIDESHWEKPCWIGSNPPVSLSYLVEDYIQHMRHHVAQLER